MTRATRRIALASVLVAGVAGSIAQTQSGVGVPAATGDPHHLARPALTSRRVPPVIVERAMNETLVRRAGPGLAEHDSSRGGLAPMRDAGGSQGEGVEFVADALSQAKERTSRPLLALPRQTDVATVDALSFVDVGRDEQGVLAHARGTDRAAPRELALWRIDPGTGDYALLSRTMSGSDGAFAFEALLVSPQRVRLVVTDVASTPDSEGASAAVALDAERLPPPQLQVIAADEEIWQLRVHAAPGASLLVDRREGGTRSLIPAPTRSASRRQTTLQLAAPRGGSLLLAQETQDGRRSGWVAVGRENPDSGFEAPLSQPLEVTP